jgi:hypothetical protein
VSLIRGALFEAIRAGQRPREALESDEALLNALSEINVDEPFYAVPEALNLRAA